MHENTASFFASISQAGKQLGFWNLIEQRGQISALQLAHSSGIAPEKAQEWLDLMATYGSLQYAPASQNYRPSSSKN